MVGLLLCCPLLCFFLLARALCGFLSVCGLALASCLFCFARAISFRSVAVLFVWTHAGLHIHTPLPPFCGCSFLPPLAGFRSVLCQNGVFTCTHCLPSHTRTPDPLSPFPPFVSLFLSPCPRTCNWVSIHIYTLRLLFSCGGVRRPPPRAASSSLFTNYQTTRMPMRCSC